MGPASIGVAWSRDGSVHEAAALLDSGRGGKRLDIGDLPYT